MLRRAARSLLLRASTHGRGIKGRFGVSPDLDLIFRGEVAMFLPRHAGVIFQLTGVGAAEALEVFGGSSFWHGFLRVSIRACRF